MDEGLPRPIIEGPEDGGRLYSSSSSMPSVVMALLRDLDVRRLGDGAVTTIEIDPAVSRQARGRLDRAGLRPAVVVGDGSAGYPHSAPYDRVLATCGLRSIPTPGWSRPGPAG